MAGVAQVAQVAQVARRCFLNNSPQLFTFPAEKRRLPSHF